MSYSLPQLEAMNGHGFAHEICIKGSQPRELVANVEGDPAYWPQARAFAAAPALLSACWAAKLILNEINDEYDWSPEEQLLLDAALAECSIAIAQAEDKHAPMTIEQELARR